MFRNAAEPPPSSKDAAALFEDGPDDAPRTRRRVTAIVTTRAAAREARLLEPAVRACRTRGDALEVALLPVRDEPSDAAAESVRQALGVERVEPIPPPRPRAGKGGGQPEMRHAYRAYAFLTPRGPDVVVSTQAFGAPYFAMRARDLGVRFRRTRFVVVLEPFELQRRLNERVITWTPEALVLFQLERAVAAGADVCVAPSRRFVRNALGTGAAAGESRFAVLPEMAAVSAASAAGAERPAGFVIPDAAPAARNVVLFAAVARRRPDAVRGVDGRIRLHVETAGGTGALAALCRDRFGATEVAWTVGPRDTGTAGGDTVLFAPFCEDFFVLGGALAPAVGGAPLVIGEGAAPGEPFEAAGVAVPPFPDDVAAALSEAAAGRRTLRVEARPADRETAWVRCLSRLAPPAPAATAPADRPARVTVCVLHCNRPALAGQAVASALDQTYEHLDVLIFDDGSDAPGAVEALDALAAAHASRVRLVRGDNRYLGAARNRAARAAAGEYVYFLDDDNVLKPGAIATLAHAARASGADFIGSFSDVFTGDDAPDPAACADERTLQAGGDAGYGLFYNAILDGNALCRRDAFLALGGNTEEYGIGKDDQEFFARAVQAGRRVAVVPEALVWARHGAAGIKRMHADWNAGHFRVLEAYWPTAAPAHRGLLLLAQGMLVRQIERNAQVRSLSAALDALSAALDAARRRRPILALARRRQGAGRLRAPGRTRLEVSALFPPDWRAPTDESGRTPIFELRRNGRRAAQAGAPAGDPPVLRLPVRTGGRLLGDTIYSLHDARTGDTLAAVVAPACWRARRIDGAVEDSGRPEARGWALDPDDPDRSRTVAVHLDGRPRAALVAAAPRRDVARWKGTGGRHGFAWPVPGAAAADGTRIDVFDAATGRPLRGSPIRIERGRAVASRPRGK